MKKCFMIIAVGILLLAIDIKIPVGEAYPEMLKAEDLGTVFQGKVIEHFIGTRPLLDVLPDVLGFFLIFLGSVLLAKKNYRFIISALLTPAAIYLSVILPTLAYKLQKRDLYLKVAGYHFLLAAVEIAIEYFVIHGMVSVTNCLQNKWHNNELLIGWIVAMTGKGMLVGIDFFFGEKIFYYIYYLILIGATFFYLQRLYITSKFKMEEEQ